MNSLLMKQVLNDPELLREFVDVSQPQPGLAVLNPDEEKRRELRKWVKTHPKLTKLMSDDLVRHDFMSRYMNQYLLKGFPPTTLYKL